MDNLLQPLMDKNSQSFQQLSSSLSKQKKTYHKSTLQHFAENVDKVTRTIVCKNQDGFQQIQNQYTGNQNHLIFIEKIIAKTNLATQDLLSGLNQVKLSQQQISDHEPLYWKQIKANKTKGAMPQQNQNITAVQNHDQQSHEIHNQNMGTTQQIIIKKEEEDNAANSPQKNIKDFGKYSENMPEQNGPGTNFAEKTRQEKIMVKNKKRNERATQIFWQKFHQIIQSVSSKTQQGLQEIEKTTMQEQRKPKVDIVQQLLGKTVGAKESLILGLNQLEIRQQEEGQTMVQNNKEIQKQHQVFKEFTSDSIIRKSPRHSHLYRINRVSKKQSIKKQMDSQIRLKNSLQTFKQSSELRDENQQHLLLGKNILDYVKESKKKKISNLGFKQRVSTIPDAYTAPSAFKNQALHLPNIRQQRKNGQMFPLVAKTQKMISRQTYS